ncbi:hypothetical protein BJX68DRAFT_226526 [Aspergillus pseudodeflectus]|uniref:Uncharacterized protein n=1 Tax=Aspergillus pseudodeflectus TaxID=176178 RepID=A0ABR4L4X2_9EURO
MRIPTILTIFATLTVQTASHDVRSNHILQTSLQNPHHAQTPHLKSTNDDREIPLATRIHWMRQTFHALNASGSPCPPYPFAAVIVNHTNTNPNTNPSSDNGSGNDITNASSALGELICTGVNQSRQMGNMVLHGEISAILNCTSILQDPVGKYKLSPAETVEAFEDLSLYTNAESCPMVSVPTLDKLLSPFLLKEITAANNSESSARPPSGGMGSRSTYTERRSPDWLNMDSCKLRFRRGRFLRRRRGCRRVRL